MILRLCQDAPGSEDREMLANLAASAHNGQSADDEAAIEKYLRSVLSLENILTLDRLRQVGRETGDIDRLKLDTLIDRQTFNHTGICEGLTHTEAQKIHGLLKLKSSKL